MSWRATVDQVRAKGYFFTSCVISIQSLRYGAAVQYFKLAMPHPLKSLVLIFMDLKLIRLYERITPVDLYDFYSIEVHVHLIVPLTASWRVSWY
jgi:hypothetical protein